MPCSNVTSEQQGLILSKPCRRSHNCIATRRQTQSGGCLSPGKHLCHVLSSWEWLECSAVLLTELCLTSPIMAFNIPGQCHEFCSAPILQTRVVPVLKSIISKGPSGNHTVLIEGAIDLAATLLKDSPADGVQMIHKELSEHIIRLMCTCDDPGILQSSCDFLRYVLSARSLSDFGSFWPQFQCLLWLCGCHATY